MARVSARRDPVTLKTVLMSILGIDLPIATRSVGAAASRAAPAKAILHI